MIIVVASCDRVLGPRIFLLADETDPSKHAAALFQPSEWLRAKLYWFVTPVAFKRQSFSADFSADGHKSWRGKSPKGYCHIFVWSFGCQQKFPMDTLALANIIPVIFFSLWNKSHARSDFLSFVGKRKFSSDQLFNGRKRQCIRWTITKIKFSCSLLVQAHDEEVRNVYIFLYFSPQIK